MNCSKCSNWSRGCVSSKPEAREWDSSRGFTGPLAPQVQPPGPPCPGFVADKRMGSRTTTPVVR